MEARLVPMRSDGHPARSGAHSSDGWEVDSPWHFHDMHQLLYAFEGSVEVEGRAGRYKVPRQFAVWIPAGAVHRTTIQKVRSGSVFLTPQAIPSAGDVPRVVAVPDLMRAMIIHAMRWPLDHPADDVSTAYFDCFTRLCAEWISREVRLILPASADKRIDAIMAYTRDHIATVRMTDICRAFGMSERSLRRHFIAGAGISWEEFRQRQCICLAIDDLDTGAKPVSAIAADIGYDNPAAFAKMFRTVMGLTPSEYRKSRRGYE